MRKDYYTKYRPIGFTYHADAYCYECGVELPEVDPEGNDRHAVMPWDELYVAVSDDDGVTTMEPYPCGKCGAPIA